MDSLHRDPECERAIIQLNNALREFHRMTGRSTLLMLVPYTMDEKIHISQDGQSLASVRFTPEEMLINAMRSRYS